MYSILVVQGKIMKARANVMLTCINNAKPQDRQASDEALARWG